MHNYVRRIVNYVSLILPNNLNIDFIISKFVIHISFAIPCLLSLNRQKPVLMAKDFSKIMLPISSIKGWLNRTDFTFS